MTNTRRGLSRERHASLQLGVAALAVAGFGVSWLALGSHHTVAQPPQPLGVTTSTAAPASSAAPEVSPTAGATAVPTRRPRTSRGS